MSVATKPAIAQTAVDTIFGVDALHPGEVGVLGRRLDGAAEQRPVEEPAECDRHDRHDDEDRELRAADPDAADVVPVLSMGDRVRRAEVRRGPDTR